ncbi:dihydroneopterin aldolase [Carboxydothermus pertinax]|uniref:7,8-dihydroneopterin aldolase n=1 Tax=Carboxydothermus pertinax TaxID=870242 RepID=A0A1L8CW78_9THEO|nr:dihydroneopterin aldolase [Carboxydothermus pertinax]GAV23205.1 dihydroneopterin aldolase [Carboxydothermus pertinax]
MDKIVIKGAVFYAYHGVLPEEKVLGQKFILDLELGLSLEAAGKRDDLTQTVSYKEVLEAVEDVVVNNRFNLIEALAEKIAQRILADFPRVLEVKVTVHKPGAPLPQSFSDVYIEIKRSR